MYILYSLQSILYRKLIIFNLCIFILVYSYLELILTLQSSCVCTINGRGYSEHVMTDVCEAVSCSRTVEGGPSQTAKQPSNHAELVD